MELLVVIGIIALLISILIPTLAGVRRSAVDLKCSSNLRQLASALIQYSTDWKGKYPPNIDALSPAPTNGTIGWSYWFDVDRIGKYLPQAIVEPGTESVGGTVMICPATPEEGRSYSMNIWASSLTDNSRLRFGTERRTYPAGTAWSPGFPSLGTFFDANEKNASKLILLSERHAEFPIDGALVTRATVGFLGQRAGQRFVGIPGGVALYPSGSAQAELDYSRHRRRGPTGTVARGRIPIAFADGHVEFFAHDDLADVTTSRSTLRAFWSPHDPRIP